MSLALAAQFLLTSLDEPRMGWGTYALSAVAAVAAARHLPRHRAAGPRQVRRADPAPEVREGAWRRGPRLSAAGALVGAGVLAALASAGLLLAGAGHAAPFWLWVAGLALVTVGIGLVSGPGPRSEAANPPRRRAEALFLVTLLALTLALRLPNLAAIPPEVHGDEAAIGLEARKILHGEVPSYYGVGWFQVPRPSFGIAALSMAVFGDDLFGLRMASVVLGTISVPLLYLVAKRLFSVPVASVAAVLMAVSHWHVHFSRTGFHYMQALFAGLLLYWLLLRGIQGPRPLDFLLAGFAAGLCFDVYFAARLAPALAALYLVHRAATERGFARRQAAGLATVALGAALFLAPMAAYYAQFPGTLWRRAGDVFIFHPKNLAHATHSYDVDGVEEVLGVQVTRSLSAFHLTGETSQQHARRGPLLDFWSGALLVPGLALAMARWRRASYFFSVGWFWVTLVAGAMLTVDAPFSPRLVGMVPVLFVFPALTLDAGWRAAAERAGERGRRIFGGVVVGFLAIAAFSNYETYFDHHIRIEQPAGFYTVLSRHVAAINDKYRIYLVGRPDVWLGYEAPRFLIPTLDGVDLRDGPLAFPPHEVLPAKGAAFLVDHALPDAPERLAAIQEAYPGGEEALHETTKGVALFYSYLVEREQLLEALDASEPLGDQGRRSCPFRSGGRKGEPLSPAEPVCVGVPPRTAPGVFRL